MKKETLHQRSQHFPYIFDYYCFIELLVRKLQELNDVSTQKYELLSRHARQKPDFQEKYFL